MAGKHSAGDGQRHTDAVEAVELPVGVGGKQRQGGQDDPHHPHHARHYQCTLLLEVGIAEWEADDQEPLQGDEADEESRHLAGHDGQKARHLARGAVSPGDVLPQVATQVLTVRYADDGQVDAHEEIRHAQHGGEDIKAVAGLVQHHARYEGDEVAHHGQSSEQRQEAAVDVGPQQVLARGDFVRRRLALCQVQRSR